MLQTQTNLFNLSPMSDTNAFLIGVGIALLATGVMVSIDQFSTGHIIISNTPGLREIVGSSYRAYDSIANLFAQGPKGTDLDKDVQTDERQ